MKRLLLPLLALAAWPALAAPRHLPVPGGVAVVPLQAPAG